MLRSRIIPVLLMRDKGLTKTVQFGDGKYIGDPQNAIKIFNEKEADELCLLDIDATVQGSSPNFDLIAKVADQCRMPLSYGGGITSADQAERIIRLGVEKVTLGSRVIEEPSLIAEIAGRIGSQSVAVVIDVKNKRLGRGRYEVRANNGTRRLDLDPLASATLAVEAGAGEIVLNSIDNDGMMKGYDLDLARIVRSAIDVPMTVVGGAGSLKDIQLLVDELGPVGAGVGSFFVFKGPYKAVLINYQRPSGTGGTK